MNKCNFCKCSIPTGQTGAWKCDFANYTSKRELWCRSALKTMMEYNQVRSGSNKKFEKENKV